MSIFGLRPDVALGAAAIIGVAIVGAIVRLVVGARGRSRRVDLRNFTLSREWVVHHQTSDR
jgi:hypothetical protein